MRTSRKNKQIMWYSLQGDVAPIYERDENGRVIYDEIDGERIPRETGESETEYSDPVRFLGNISFYIGWGYARIWGITLGDADAVLLMDKDEIPIDETSRIWFQTEPEYKDDGTIDADSADFTVSRVLPSIHQVRYLLKGNDR